MKIIMINNYRPFQFAITNSDKVILPGQGSFKNCMESLLNIKGLKNTLTEFSITKSKPLLGICVGMQMFANIGFEEDETVGLGWIPGNVIKIDNEKKNFFLVFVLECKCLLMWVMKKMKQKV